VDCVSDDDSLWFLLARSMWDGLIGIKHEIQE
jgi:hypothetical protein